MAQGQLILAVGKEGSSAYGEKFAAICITTKESAKQPFP